MSLYGPRRDASQIGPKFFKGGKHDNAVVCDLRWKSRVEGEVEFLKTADKAALAKRLEALRPSSEERVCRRYGALQQATEQAFIDKSVKQEQRATRALQAQLARQRGLTEAARDKAALAAIATGKLRKQLARLQRQTRRTAAAAEAAPVTEAQAATEGAELGATSARGHATVTQRSQRTRPTRATHSARRRSGRGRPSSAGSCRQDIPHQRVRERPQSAVPQRSRLRAARRPPASGTKSALFATHAHVGVGKRQAYQRQPEAQFLRKLLETSKQVQLELKAADDAETRMRDTLATLRRSVRSRSASRRSSRRSGASSGTRTRRSGHTRSARSRRSALTDAGDSSGAALTDAGDSSGAALTDAGDSSTRRSAVAGGKLKAKPQPAWGAVTCVPLGPRNTVRTVDALSARKAYLTTSAGSSTAAILRKWMQSSSDNNTLARRHEELDEQEARRRPTKRSQKLKRQDVRLYKERMDKAGGAGTSKRLQQILAVGQIA